MPSASEPFRASSLISVALARHRKGGAQTGRLVIWSHRHEVNFAFTGSVDKLQSHLDPVGIRLVEDELRIPNERLALGIERTRVGRIRICFTQTTTFIPAESATGPENAPPGARQIPQTFGLHRRWYRHRLCGFCSS